MSFAIYIDLDEAATPVLRDLSAALEDREALHAAVAGRAEIATRDHVLDASRTRHKTAERLGARPTGYLERAAQGVTSRADADAAVVVLGGDNAIFARAFGEVTVRPRRAKNLAIPAKAAAYGKRPGEFDDLTLLIFRPEAGGFAMALGREGEGDAPDDVFFWLVKKAVLPKDEGLLPTADQYAAVAELGALDYLDAIAPAEAA